MDLWLGNHPAAAPWGRGQDVAPKPWCAQVCTGVYRCVCGVSGADIPGDIYVYYKNSASDLLYGGITYRVAVKGGLAAGKSTQVIAGHYVSGGSRIVSVDCGD